MNEFKCIIIDNEAHAIKHLEGLILQIGGLKLIGKYENPLIALNNIRSRSIEPDLLFLDIEMPEISGIQFINMISSFPITSIICTGFPNFAVPAFETEAVAFVVKPISYERLSIAVDKAKRKHQENAKLELDAFFIEIQSKGKFMKITYDEVFFIEGSGNYLSVNLETVRHLTHISLTAAVDFLPDNIFLRVHKTFIVNLKKIKIVEGDSILLTNGKEIPIGAVYKPTVMKIINDFLMHKRRGTV